MVSHLPAVQVQACPCFLCRAVWMCCCLRGVVVRCAVLCAGDSPSSVCPWAREWGLCGVQSPGADVGCHPSPWGALPHSPQHQLPGGTARGETLCMGDPPHTPFLPTVGGSGRGGPSCWAFGAAGIPRISEPNPPSLLSPSPAPRACSSTWALALSGGSSPQGGGPAVTPACSPDPGSWEEPCQHPSGQCLRLPLLSWGTLAPAQFAECAG